MIEIVGDEGTSEYEAAQSLADGFRRMWRGCADSPAAQDEIRIAANVKISGYRVSDIDLVVFGRFGRARKFVPTYPVKDMQGNVVRNRPVIVQNFVVAVEVKDHSETGVNISGDRIDVRYVRAGKDRWHSATDQNINQVHSLRAYIKDHGLDAWLHRCLIMRGLTSINCPGAVCAGFDGPGFLTAVAAVSRVRQAQSGFVLSSCDKTTAARIGKLPIFRKLLPTAMDRVKMDAIVSKTAESEALCDSLGHSFTVLRGRGGTGKTIMLLQSAWHAFESKGLRTLVLTYNHALAADIRRILALLRVPADPERGGITVETAMSFMSRWLRELGVGDESAATSEAGYREACAAAVELIRGGALQQEDIAEIIASNPSSYDFDIVVVDEAQDWPQEEAELLKDIYGGSRLALADGVDQLVRGERTKWITSAERSDAHVIPLQTCLRMKRNLASFANAVGEESNTGWHVTPNDVAGGGRVIVLRRPYKHYAELHDSLVSSAKASGNSELDFLFCVPSGTVSTKESGKVSELADLLEERGSEVWDGVDSDRRRDFPRSTGQFRIVQYASCRGLEGWTVVLEGLDAYWEECRYWRQKQGLSHEEELAFGDLGEISYRDAWHRVLIALTRPIDTLVVTLSNPESKPSIDLLNVARKMPDVVAVLE